MNTTTKTTLYIGKTEIPSFLVREYEGGKHWPEAGEWDVWLAEKLKGFEQSYIVIRHDAYSTYTGGTILLVTAITKSDFDALIAGTICPECGWGFMTTSKKPDDVACHLVDNHQWDDGKALAWLRDKIEEAAFYDRP